MRGDVMTLRELRKNKGITQQQAADFVGVPLRTYSDYENNIKKQSSIKYKYILEKLYSYGYIDEENGILSIHDIEKICKRVTVINKGSIVRDGAFEELKTTLNDIETYCVNRRSVPRDKIYSDHSVWNAIGEFFERVVDWDWTDDYEQFKKILDAIKVENTNTKNGELNSELSFLKKAM